MTLRLAVVGGPMYDDLYDALPFDVEIVIHADHPTLNREVAARLAAGERLDLISTHGKYAPSQQRWLRPLDHIVDRSRLDGLAERAVDLCRFRGELLCTPRNIDVRVLWWRTDRMHEAPTTWKDVVDSDGVFGFTGRESGLFGLFYELVAAAGEAVFDPDGRPTLDTSAAMRAVEAIVDLAALAPTDLADWHYDDVDDALVDGRIDMAATWPGGYRRIAASDVYSTLAPAPYPGGRSYSGCHAWAIPTTCGDVDAAAELLGWLTSQEAGAIDSAGGSIPANSAAMAAHQPRDSIDAARLGILGRTVDGGMLTYPPLEHFPAIEDGAWSAIRDAITGAHTPAEAIISMQNSAELVLGEIE